MSDTDDIDYCQACGREPTKALGLVYCEGSLVLCEVCDELPKSVTLLLEREDGLVLAVSRRNDPTKFGLPGGKVEPGETMLQALAREVKEETGLHIEDATPVFVAACEGDVTYLDTTYRAKTKGTPYTDEPVRLEWVTRDVLLAGPFANYIRNMFAVLDNERG